ncbi:MAG: limonene-1,2-epoxide hydrolase family protein [Pseudomonadota bacterium]
MSQSNTEQVLAFIDAWNRMDWDAIEGAFTEDVVYHNMPMEALEGKAAAMGVIRGMAPESVNWRVVAIAENADGAVLTERVDDFIIAGGKPLSLPVMGIFEFRDGKISAWRDYFDLASYMNQLGAGE